MDLILVEMLPYNIVECTAFKRLNFKNPQESYICEKLEAVIEEFKLENKIHMGISDNAMKCAMKIADFALFAKEWKIISEIVNLLQSFYEATPDISRDSAPISLTSWAFEDSKNLFKISK
ncbi:hypothetical protein FF38_04216 [Lucilia cuprina]|uniref:Uncharacterized protein n=1 Tax=Lucilia cuprina TaxID=7375 RepID=A0A0L0BLI0_LUCCU|nr:hypothetical protein FF38_04216 [Lucilia cuprina]